MWTYTAGQSDDSGASCCNCPCATTPGPSPPAAVGNDYDCESGNVGGFENSVYYLSDPLWDGNGCSSTSGCCGRIGMPWFYKKLPQEVTEDFKVRICKDENLANENIAIEKLELYVHC